MTDEAIEGELLPALPDRLPSERPEWVPRGRAGDMIMSELGKLAKYDPDRRLSAEAAEMFSEGIAESTVSTLGYQWLRVLVWCGETGREHLPMTVQTVQEWMTANYTMKHPDGTLRGRKGQPYAPSTVRLSLAAIARAHRRYYSKHPEALARYYAENPGELDAAATRMGRHRGAMPSPTAHDDVVQHMKGYAKRWKRAGFREDLAATITVDDMFALVRTQDIDGTCVGLRNAFLFRLAAETGRRASDLTALDWSDLRWLSSTRLEVTIPYGKTNQEGEAGDTAYVDADETYEPGLDTLLLGREWKELCASRGYTSGPVFRQCRQGTRRKDGTRSGSILNARMTRKDYADQIAKAAKESGVDHDPVTGDLRKCTPHMFRVLMATSALGAGVSIGSVCDQGGWSRNSPVVLRYDRAAKRDGESPGAYIRRAAEAARDAEAAKKRGGK